MSQNQYETTFIMTPVLSEEDAKRTAKAYTQLLKDNNAEIILEENWGLKQLAYPIAKKTTGIYHHVEFKAPAEVIAKLELAYRRDEDNILRFMTIRLDKYAVEYNDKKRKGLVGRNKKVQKKEDSPKNEED